MTKEELISRMEDTGIQRETLSVVLNTLLSTSTINVRRLSLPIDKKTHNVSQIDSKDSYLISSQVLIFKTLIRKISKMDISSFTKYGINDEVLLKLLSLTDEEIIKWFKGNIIPNNDRSYIDIMIMLGHMSSIIDMYGSQRVDIFEEKKQETKYKNRSKNPEQYTKRIYLNLPLNKTAVEFLTLFKIKCIEKGIPSKMKGMGSSGHEEGDLDTTIIYSNDYYLLDHINIIESIIKERRDLTKDFGTPVISGARVKSENDECYYTVSSGLLSDTTSNNYYDKLYKIAFAFLCSKYVQIDRKYDIPTLCQMNSSELKEYTKTMFDKLDQDIKDRIISEGHFEEIVCQVSSYLRFGDFNHTKVPLYQDELFSKFAEEKNDNEKVETKPSDAEILEEIDLYLYKTEDLINNVLELYKQGDFSFYKLMENYLKRITTIYKKYRYYAVREKGFITTERNKKIMEIFNKLLNGCQLPETTNELDMLEFYQELQANVNDYLNNNQFTN